jgi:hypothetical protein
MKKSDKTGPLDRFLKSRTPPATSLSFQLPTSRTTTSETDSGWQQHRSQSVDRTRQPTATVLTVEPETATGASLPDQREVIQIDDDIEVLSEEEEEEEERTDSSPADKHKLTAFKTLSDGRPWLNPVRARGSICGLLCFFCMASRAPTADRRVHRRHAADTQSRTNLPRIPWVTTPCVTLTSRAVEKHELSAEHKAAARVWAGQMSIDQLVLMRDAGVMEALVDCFECIYYNAIHMVSFGWSKND